MTVVLHFSSLLLPCFYAWKYKLSGKELNKRAITGQLEQRKDVLLLQKAKYCNRNKFNKEKRNDRVEDKGLFSHSRYICYVIQECGAALIITFTGSICFFVECKNVRRKDTSSPNTTIMICQNLVGDYRSKMNPWLLTRFFHIA
ncbi:hypothetical protein BDC45DRAFT_538042 [Circinella umbellata]|nr:hypothetical protein BDC45DRAFT_538042 [Circinella umbellata]